MADYYDQYWKAGIEGGVLNLPPEWSSGNLAWHLGFFGRYIVGEVLDAGAGDGTFLSYVAGKHPGITKSIAAELSREAIRKGRELHPRLTFVQAGLERLPFDDRSFDTVLAIEVVEHLLDIDACLAEVQRVLKPGGYFCVTTTDFNWLKKVVIAGLYWDKFFYPNNPHIRFFTKRTLRDICQKHALELVAYRWNRSYVGLMPKGQMSVFQKVKSDTK